MFPHRYKALRTHLKSHLVLYLTLLPVAFGIMHVVLCWNITDAVEQGDYRKVRWITTLYPPSMKARASYDGMCERTMLANALWVVHNGGYISEQHKNIARFLVERGADVNERCWAGKTPLHFAAESGDAGIVLFLLEHGAKVNGKDANGWTSLHDSCCWSAVGKTAVTDLLLKYGADPNARNNDGESVLDTAVANGCKKTVMLLRQFGSKDPVSIYEAAAFGDIVTLKKLLKAQPRLVKIPSIRGWTVLDYAAVNKQRSAVHELLKQGAKIDTKALISAVRSGDTDIVDLMVKYGADVRSKHPETLGESCLRVAAEAGDLRMLRYLVSKGVIVKGDHYALKSAVGSGNVAVVEELLLHGADINTADKADPDAQTCLHTAMIEGHKKMFRFLLEHGADPKLPSQGRPISDHAVANKDKHFAKMLCEYQD